MNISLAKSCWCYSPQNKRLVRYADLRLVSAESVFLRIRTPLRWIIYHCELLISVRSRLKSRVILHEESNLYNFSEKVVTHTCKSRHRKVQKVVNKVISVGHWANTGSFIRTNKLYLHGEHIRVYIRLLHLTRLLLLCGRIMFVILIDK